MLKKLAIPVEALFSTLGRVAARAIETKVIGDAMGTGSASWSKYQERRSQHLRRSALDQMPAEGMGAGLNDVPRGALGHWISIKDKKIANYQMVVPPPGISARVMPPIRWARWKKR